MASIETGAGRVLVARLEHGGDLLEEIIALADAHQVEAGALQGVGALQRARLAFYDQDEHVYRETAFDEPLELLTLAGNVSRREGRTMPHVHLTLAREDGSALGGHAAPGCVVFACELTLSEWPAISLERAPDTVTGLPLWQGL